MQTALKPPREKNLLPRQGVLLSFCASLPKHRHAWMKVSDPHLCFWSIKDPGWEAGGERQEAAPLPSLTGVGSPTALSNRIWVITKGEQSFQTPQLGSLRVGENSGNALPTYRIFQDYRHLGDVLMSPNFWNPHSRAASRFP